MKITHEQIYFKMTITSNFLSATTNTLRDLVPTYRSEHMPYYFCLIYSTPATLAFWLFLKHLNNVPASGTWHFLFNLSSECSCCRRATGLLPDFIQSLLSCNPPGRLSWLFYLRQPMVSLSFFPYFIFFSPAHITACHEWYGIYLLSVYFTRNKSHAITDVVSLVLCYMLNA